MYRNYIKRIQDGILALFSLILLSPLILIVTILLHFSNKGKVFFLQDRPGLGQEIFKIIKFKTMKDLKDEHGNPLPDKDRLTNIGSFIRKFSIDELPQLLNVIRGEMSLVGPRPLLPRYLPLYNDHQQKRHDVLPGITGLAQINGRNDLSWNEKLENDVYYVENLSFYLDLKILFITVGKVVYSKGISKKGHATNTFFKGN